MSQSDRRPTTILATHWRLRADGFPVVSIVCGRRVSDSRVFLSGWLAERSIRLILAPDASFESGCSAYRFHAGDGIIEQCVDHLSVTPQLPTLLFVDHLPQTLEAAVEFAEQWPCAPVSIATTADAVLEVLLRDDTPTSLVSAALQGLVPVEAVEDRILKTVVNARQLAPLLRSPYEGLVYYMLETRRETQGQFEPNQRIDKPSGRGSYEVDLLCKSAKLIIEIDGTQHNSPQQAARDQTKQRDLEELGYSVRRFSTGQVTDQPVGVWRLICEQLTSLAAE